MKIVYYANHKNIKGYEQIKVEQNIDALENVNYQVILDSKYAPVDRYERVIGLFNNIKEAIELADNYSTID
jgi:hypothetical protein